MASYKSQIVSNREYLLAISRSRHFIRHLTSQLRPYFLSLWTLWLPTNPRLLANVHILTISHSRHYIGILTSDFGISAIFSEFMDVMASYNAQSVSNREYTRDIAQSTLYRNSDIWFRNFSHLFWVYGRYGFLKHSDCWQSWMAGPFSIAILNSTFWLITSLFIDGFCCLWTR